LNIWSLPAAAVVAVVVLQTHPAAAVVLAVIEQM
jgi:hypothetical protein